MLIEDTLRNVNVDVSKLMIRRYLDKLTLNELSTEMGISVNILRRKLNKAILKCYEYFCKQGYCTPFIEQEFGTEKWLVGIYERKYQNLKKPKEEDRVVFIPQKSNSSFSVCFAI